MQSNIDTIVFDYGGVIVNLRKDIKPLLTKLGISHLRAFFMQRRIRRLVYEFIDGIRPTEDVINEMLSFCRRGTTRDELLAVLDTMNLDIPTARLETIRRLRGRCKVYLLSNINAVLWADARARIEAAGYSLDELFDGLFLSYEMRVAKPDSGIYEKLFAATGLTPSRTLYFDDNRKNVRAGRSAGLCAVLVPANELEGVREYRELSD